MLRRDFCKFLAITAASETVPAFGQTAQDNPPNLPNGFDQYIQDYAQFCALPPHERVFYRVSNGSIVATKLDDATWGPASFDKPVLPIPGGSWDGVPMDSPIPDLAGDGPYKPTWDSLLQYDAAEWYRVTPSSGSGPTGARSACPKPAIGTRAICTSRDRRRINTTSNITGRPHASVTKTSAPSGLC